MNENGTQDIFVHYSSILSDGCRTLKSGQIVNFDLKEGEKGLHAEILFQLAITSNAERDISFWQLNYSV